MNIGNMAKGMSDVQAWIHDVMQDDGEADQALSFSADSFPLQGVGGFRSLRARPLYTAAPAEILLAYENMIADHSRLQQQLAAAREALVAESVRLELLMSRQLTVKRMADTGLFMLLADGYPVTGGWHDTEREAIDEWLEVLAAQSHAKTIDATLQRDRQP